MPEPTITVLKFQRRRFTMKRPETSRLGEELRSLMDEYDAPLFTVGEVFGLHPTLRRFMHVDCDELYSALLFTISDLKIFAAFFGEQIRTFEAFYPHPLLSTYVFSNHDRPRSIKRLDNDVQKAKLLALPQLNVRGIVFVYQVEEAGMHAATFRHRIHSIPLAETTVRCRRSRARL